MTTPERFLVTRFDNFKEQWMTRRWFGDNCEKMFQAFRAIQEGRCYAVLVDRFGVRCVSYEEHKRLSNKLWHGSEAKKRFEQHKKEKVSEVMNLFREIQSEASRRQHQPKEN